MDKKDAIIEYDRYYRKKPEKWTSLERNEYAHADVKLSPIFNKAMRED